MLILISSTGNRETMTYKVARVYQQLLASKSLTVPILSLDSIQENFIKTASTGIRDADFDRFCQEKLTPLKKIIVITAEYNGSIPGLFKTFLDACDLSVFRGKKAALVGLAAGRAGNLRGMDHLTDIFHNMGVEVLSYKVPISRIQEELSANGDFIKPDTPKALEKQINLFLNF